MDTLVPLWLHQMKGVERAKALDYFAFFFEPGTGKSATVINTLRHKFNYRKKVLKTLIFCPPVVVPNWRDEWKKHSLIDIEQVVLLQGSAKKRHQTFLREIENGPKIFVTNYEALLMGELFDAFQAWAPEALVMDESHRLKSRTSQRAKLAALLANPYDKAKRLALPKPLTYLLSGSPVLNSPMDLFMQYLVMDGGETFGDNFWVFQAKYFIDKNAWMKNSPRHRHFPDWQVRPGAVEEINRLISQTSMRAEKKDCLDLPPMVYQTIKVPMSAEQARLYKEMKNELITFLGDKACTGPLAITKAIRLQQIASGYIKTVDGEELALGATPKQEALKELLEDLAPDHKVLVWAVYHQNYKQIREVCDALKLKFVEVHGQVSARQKEENVKAFQTDPTVRVLIGHPGSGGIGINLVQASYGIFFSRSFSFEESEQAEARNYRGGSREQGHTSITRIDLVTEKTIDEQALAAVKNKQAMSLSLLREIKTSL